MPTALIVSRYFPPLSSAGASIRLVKWMKYAVEENWSFVVLTQDPDRTVIPEKRLSEFLLAEIPAETNIIRVGNPFWGQTLLVRLARKIVKDSSLPWGGAVAWQAWDRLKQSKPDMIFVNTPPFTNVAVGILLSIIFNIPLVLDMKDDWVGSPAYRRKGQLRRGMEAQIEKLVMRTVSAVVVVTRTSYEAYLQRYASLSEKFFLIPNGEDMEEYSILWNQKRSQLGERFHLLSAAAGYHPDYRDLTSLLQALELFFERCPSARDNIDIEFLGEDPDSSYKTWFEKHMSTSAVHYSSAFNRRAFIERLWQADLFFLVQPRENFTAISGTLYEYWATGKAPVLLFAEFGASSNLVNDNKLGEHFHFSQVQEASQYIEQTYQAFCNRQPVWIERSGSEAYDRRNFAQQMLSIWSDAINGRR